MNMDEILAYNDSENQVNVEDNEINREIYICIIRYIMKNVVIQ